MVKKITFILLLITLFACSNNDNRLLSGYSKHYQPSLINYAFLFTDEENYISFPNWFNDSMISSHRISKIIRKSYMRMNEIESEIKSNKPFVPREIKEYRFLPSGSISQLLIRNFYDEKEIGSHVFSFKGQKDNNGYFETSLLHYFNSELTSDQDDELFSENLETNQYKIYDKIRQTSSYYAYQERELGDYLYYIIHPKHWGALSVDSLVSPNPKDEIILGKQKLFTKKYQVMNTIKEYNVRIYNYDNKHSKKIINWVKKDYPFEQKRDFLYYENGLCYSYIDSIFSDEEFVTRTISSIKYNKKKEPVNITHLKENENGDTLFISKDVFQYFRR